MGDREQKPGDGLVERIGQRRQQQPGRPRVARATVTVVLSAVAVLLVLLFFWQLRQLVVYVFLALLVAAALQAPVAFLERHRFPLGLAIATPYIVMLALLVGVGFLVVPPLVRQLAQLAQDLPAYLKAIEGWLQGVLANLGVSGTALSDLAAQLSSGLNFGFLFRIPATIAGVIAGVAIVLVSSILLLFERRHIRNWALGLMERSDRQPAMDLITAAFDKLGGYVRAQLLVMLFVGVGNLVGMLIFGIPFAFPLGVLSFVLEAIPNFGPILAGIPIVVLGLLDSPTTGLIMFAWVLGIQQIENYLVVPLVQNRVLKISPLLVLVAVTAGIILYGILGGIIAIPIVAIGQLVVNEVLVPLRRRKLEQQREM